MEQPAASPPAADSTFLGRHEFLLRRLHSLSGIIPVGAYMVVHLLTNSTINESDATFQRLVNQIHDLPGLVVIEWLFIFLPLLYHALYGILIVRSGLPNNSSYRYTHNTRYTLQRATGMIAFLFIMWHVFHMHGWIHAEWWEKSVAGFGAMFRPYNAASTGIEAMQAAGIIYPILYVIGVLSCVFHLSNGIWTFGILAFCAMILLLAVESVLSLICGRGEDLDRLLSSRTLEDETAEALEAVEMAREGAR